MKTIRLAVMAAFLFPEGGTRFGYEDFGGFLSPLYVSE